MEVKKEELRIGNLLWEEYGGIYEVEGITQCGNVEMKKGGMTATGLYSISRLKPIELTEEWLFKFGLSSYNDIKIKDSGFICIELVNDEKLFYIIGNNNPTYSSMFKLNIKYVHQLQNLYFALTGQELTIK